MSGVEGVGQVALTGLQSLNRGYNTCDHTSITVNYSSTVQGEMDYYCLDLHLMGLLFREILTNQP